MNTIMKFYKYILFLELIFFPGSILAQGHINSYNLSYNLPNRLKRAIYRMYRVPLNAKTYIFNISHTEKEKYDGVYTFRLCFQPHAPTHMFILYGNKPYILDNLGFESPIEVIEEVSSLLSSLKADNNFIKATVSGMYTYLYDEYGASYGRSFHDHRKTDFNSDMEKEVYMKSQVTNWGMIESEGIRLRENINALPKTLSASINKNRFCKEEVIMLLRLIVMGKQ